MYRNCRIFAIPVVLLITGCYDRIYGAGRQGYSDSFPDSTCVERVLKKGISEIDKVELIENRGPEHGDGAGSRGLDTSRSYLFSGDNFWGLLTFRRGDDGAVRYSQRLNSLNSPIPSCVVEQSLHVFAQVEDSLVSECGLALSEITLDEYASDAYEKEYGANGLPSGCGAITSLESGAYTLASGEDSYLVGYVGDVTDTTESALAELEATATKMCGGEPMKVLVERFGRREIEEIEGKPIGCDFDLDRALDSSALSGFVLLPVAALICRVDSVRRTETRTIPIAEGKAVCK